MVFLPTFELAIRARECAFAGSRICNAVGCVKHISYTLPPPRAGGGVKGWAPNADSPPLRVWGPWC